MSTKADYRKAAEMIEMGYSYAESTRHFPAVGMARAIQADVDRIMTSGGVRPMSTRSTTHFTSDYDDDDVAIIYRHSDGYPEGAGRDLMAFIDEVATLRDTRFDDPSYLAARYVAFLGRMFATAESPLDFIGVGVVTVDPANIEYRYVVKCGPMGRPSVTCFSVGLTDTDDITEIPMGEIGEGK